MRSVFKAIKQKMPGSNKLSVKSNQLSPREQKDRECYEQVRTTHFAVINLKYTKDTFFLLLLIDNSYSKQNLTISPTPFDLKPEYL
jgi:hypothetical protein